MNINAGDARAPDFTAPVIARRVHSPLTLARRLGLTGGDIMHVLPRRAIAAIVSDGRCVMPGAKPVRTCGRCTLCCKVLEIHALAKPEGVWCAHCAAGQGCTIYADRPAECAAFQCRYLCDPSLGEEWYPARCHMVLRAILLERTAPAGPQRAASPSQSLMLVACVDPDRPDAWRREPYHSSLRAFARQLCPRGSQVFVKIGLRKIAVLPDGDVDLGPCTEHDRIKIRAVGSRWTATKTTPTA